MVALCKLVAYEKSQSDYTTYVFECLDDEIRKETKYLMCIRYPNWDHRGLKLGEIGYLDFEEIRAGIDKWYDGNTMIPYRYNAIQFIKFISKPENIDEEYRI